MSQELLGRKWAPSLAGNPQIRSVPTMGWVKVERKARFEVDDDMPEEQRKKEGLANFYKFIAWMKAEDGAKWDGQMPRIEGPYPHFDAKEPDVQYGDNGASRPIARNVQEDLTGNGKEDYVIFASFWVREKIQEVSTPIAQEIFSAGKGGVRPFRERN